MYIVFNFQGVILDVIKIADALSVTYSKKAPGTTNTLNNLIKLLSVQFRHLFNLQCFVMALIPIEFPL
jgi:hypothetical protein